MEAPVTIQYPVFQSNQILTSTQLNNLVTYFDTEDRISRIQLTGVGILYGFAYQISPTNVIIEGGFGVTSDGYLIGFEDKMTFAKAKVLTDSNPNKAKEITHLQKYFTDNSLQINGIVELFATTPDPAIVNNVQDWSVISPTLSLPNKALIVFWDIDNQDLKSCKGTNCDNKGQTRIFNLRVFVIDKPAPFTPIPLPVLALRRLNDEQPLTKIYNSNQINVAYQKIVKQAINGANSLAVAINTFFNRYVATFDLNPVENMEMASILSGTAVIDNQPPQYAYDFVRDCMLTYQEMVDAAIAIEQTSGHKPFSPFPQHLILGEMSHDYNLFKHDPWRHYLVQKPIAEEGLIKVKSLFHKLWLMLHNFQVPVYDISKKIIPELRITPSSTTPSPLSERAIPFYYFKNNLNFKDLTTFWNRDLSRLGLAFSQLSYHADQYSSNDAVQKPLNFDISEYPFFRIEKLLGMNLSDALNVLEDLKLNKNLPFEIAAIELINPQTYDLNTPVSLVNSKNPNSRWIHDKLNKKQKTSSDYFKGPYNHQLIHKIIGENGNLFLVSDRLNSACSYGDLDVMYRLAQTSLLMKLKETKAALLSNPLLETLVQMRYLGIDQDIEENEGIFDYLADHLSDHLHEFIDDFSDWIFNYKIMLNYLIRLKLAIRQHIEETIDNPPAQDKLLRKFEWQAISDNTIDGLLYDTNYLQINLLYHTLLWRIDYFARHDQTFFHNFVRKYTGIEHLAGVPKGGTFVVVYETNVSDQSRRVVADFALPYACTCEGCEIPIGNPIIPPIARPDFMVIQQVKVVKGDFVTTAANATIFILRNDFDASQLGHFVVNFGMGIENVPITSILTHKKGTATIVKSSEGWCIEYKNTNAEATGFDSFEYIITNVETKQQDVATVTILILPMMILEAVDDTIDLYGKKPSDTTLIVKVLENDHILNVNKKKMSLEALDSFPMGTPAQAPVKLIAAQGDEDAYFEVSLKQLSFGLPAGAFRYRINYKGVSSDALVNIAYKLLAKDISQILTKNVPLIIDVIGESIVSDKPNAILNLIQLGNDGAKEVSIIEDTDARIEVLISDKLKRQVLQFTAKKPFVSTFENSKTYKYLINIPTLGSDSAQLTVLNQVMKQATQRTVKLGTINGPGSNIPILLSDIDANILPSNVSLFNSATNAGGTISGLTQINGKPGFNYNTPTTITPQLIDSFVIRNDLGDNFDDITVEIPLRKAPRQINTAVNLGQIFKSATLTNITLTQINQKGNLNLVANKLSMWDKTQPPQTDLGGLLTPHISQIPLPGSQASIDYVIAAANAKSQDADRFWLVDESGIKSKIIEVILPLTNKGLSDTGSNSM